MAEGGPLFWHSFWRGVLSHVHDARTWHAMSLVCKMTNTITRAENLDARKLEFAKSFSDYLGQKCTFTTVKTKCILPNGLVHGLRMLHRGNFVHVSMGVLQIRDQHTWHIVGNCLVQRYREHTAWTSLISPRTIMISVCPACCRRHWLRMEHRNPGRYRISLRCAVVKYARELK